MCYIKRNNDKLAQKAEVYNYITHEKTESPCAVLGHRYFKGKV
jgi:hypothetical protein